MPVEVICTITSVGSLISGSGTVSTRTSCRPCQVTARMAAGVPVLAGTKRRMTGAESGTRGAMGNPSAWPAGRITTRRDRDRGQPRARLPDRPRAGPPRPRPGALRPFRGRPAGRGDRPRAHGRRGRDGRGRRRRSADEAQSVVAEAERRFGRLDVLVLNAGVIQVGPAAAMSDAGLRGRDGRDVLGRAARQHGGDAAAAAQPGQAARGDLGRRQAARPAPAPLHRRQARRGRVRRGPARRGDPRRRVGDGGRAGPDAHRLAPQRAVQRRRVAESRWFTAAANLPLRVDGRRAGGATAGPRHPPQAARDHPDARWPSWGRGRTRSRRARRCAWCRW